MLILVDDPGAEWSRSQQRRDSLEFFVNLIQHATGMTYVTGYGKTWAVLRDATKPAPARSLKVARIQQGTHWDPEPGGWERLSNLLHNSGQLALTTQAVPLQKDALREFKVAHFTGVGAVTFEGAQLDEVRRFIDAGGLLIIDAAGGQGEFADSAEAMLQTLFPNQNELLPVTRDHPIMQPKADWPSALYRAAALGNAAGNLNELRLREYKHNGRTAVILSRHDLSVGLVGMPVADVVGYTPEVAAQIMTRILLSAPH
jgi:hypothetical protein